MKNKLRESDIEDYGVRRVKDSGGEIRKVKYINRRDCPDRHAYFPKGVLVIVEFKAPGEKPRSGQLREHAKLRALGFRVEVIDSLLGVDRMIESVMGKMK